MGSKAELRQFLKSKREAKQEAESTISVNMFENPKVLEPVKIEQPKVNLNGLPFDFVNVDVEPIVIEDVNDTQGTLSAKVEALENMYGLSVMPFSVTGLRDNIKSLQRHMIMNIFGEKYVSGTTRIVNRELLNEVLKNIQLSLENGTTYLSSLETTLTVKDKTFKTLRFNIYELSYIRQRFINYKPEIKVTPNGDFILSVGAYD